jgi:hypothetical protein
MSDVEIIFPGSAFVILSQHQKELGKKDKYDGGCLRFLQAEIEVTEVA